MKGVPSLRLYVLGLTVRGKSLDLPIDPPHLKHNFKICYYHSFSCTISGFEKESYNRSEFFYIRWSHFRFHHFSPCQCLLWLASNAEVLIRQGKRHGRSPLEERLYGRLSILRYLQNVIFSFCAST